MFRLFRRKKGGRQQIIDIKVQCKIRNPFTANKKGWGGMLTDRDRWETVRIIKGVKRFTKLKNGKYKENPVYKEWMNKGLPHYRVKIKVKYEGEYIESAQIV